MPGIVNGYEPPGMVDKLFSIILNAKSNLKRWLVCQRQYMLLGIVNSYSGPFRIVRSKTI